MNTIDTSPILEAKNITKTFGGVRALDNVSLSLVPGDVHCIAGENGCGKSTLIKIISGVEVPDSGSIILGDHTLDRVEPAWAIRHGVQVIYQDFSLFPNLRVAENIVITSAIAKSRKTFNLRTMLPQAEAVVEELGIELNLNATVESLSVADRQLTAICRALVNDAKVLFMDEPTTALTRTEVSRFFSVVERLKDKGVALAFVSHKLDEVLEISQHVTILRNGKNVVSGPAHDLDQRAITRYMTGRDLIDARQAPVPHQGPPRLSVDTLCLEGAFADVSFDVLPGEVVGITGLLGSGRNEIAETLFGIYTPTSGAITVGDRPLHTGSVPHAAKAGIGYVPQDRLTQGLFLDKSVGDNITASSLDSFRVGGVLLDKTQIKKVIDRLFSSLKIKANSTKAPVQSLSGGNAQRVVLAKWLANSPHVLVLNGPTVGVDVGSKEEILSILRDEAAGGMGIIIISDDIPELVSICSRVLIVCNGRIESQLQDDDVTALKVAEAISR